MLYENRPASVNELLNNKYNNVHEELYNSALNKYINTLINNYINEKIVYEVLYTIYIKQNKADFNVENEINNINTPNIVLLLNELSLNKSLFFNNIYGHETNKLINANVHIENFLNENNYMNLVIGISELIGFDNFKFSTINTEIENEINEDDIILYSYLNIIYILYNDNGLKININVNDFNYNEFNSAINEYSNTDDNLTNTINAYKDIVYKLYKKYHKIIEIKNSEYWMPSNIRIIDKLPPYKRTTIDLTKYWNNIQSNEEYNISNIKIINNDINDSEITDIDYINGKAKMRSRNNDIDFEVPFKYLDENTNISEEMILKNAFETKYH